MKKKTKYISLKEAAKISGYSADYIGYLIRTGKIHGRPVYTNITWQTTAEEILNYKLKKKKKKERLGFKDKVLGIMLQMKYRVLQEIRLLKLFLKTFRFLIPIIAILTLIFAIMVGFVFFVSTGNKINTEQTTVPKETQEVLTY